MSTEEKKQDIQLYIRCTNPFIEAVAHVFSTLLTSTADYGLAKQIEGKVTIPCNGVLAKISLGGAIDASASIIFPTSTALRIAGRMMEETYDELDEMVADAVAELVNIIAGDAKTKFYSGSGEPIQLSLPTVIHSDSFHVNFQQDFITLHYDFTSELGAFSLILGFKHIDTENIKNFKESK